MNPENDATGESFSALLRFHFQQGTRPLNQGKQPGEAWGAKEFADRLGVTDKTVRNWLRGDALPSDLASVERLLFGSNIKDAYNERVRLRKALDYSLERAVETTIAQSVDDPEELTSSAKREFVERIWDKVILVSRHRTGWIPEEFLVDGFFADKNVARNIDLYNKDNLDNCFSLILNRINEDWHKFDAEFSQHVFDISNSTGVVNLIKRNDFYISKEVIDCNNVRFDISDYVSYECKYELENLLKYPLRGGRSSVENIIEAINEYTRKKIHTDVAMCYAQGIRLNRLISDKIRTRHSEDNYSYLEICRQIIPDLMNFQLPDGRLYRGLSDIPQDYIDGAEDIVINKTLSIRSTFKDLMDDVENGRVMPGKSLVEECRAALIGGKIDTFRMKA